MVARCTRGGTGRAQHHGHVTGLVWSRCGENKRAQFPEAEWPSVHPLQAQSREPPSWAEPGLSPRMAQSCPRGPRSHRTRPPTASQPSGRGRVRVAECNRRRERASPEPGPEGWAAWRGGAGAGAGGGKVVQPRQQLEQRTCDRGWHQGWEKVAGAGQGGAGRRRAMGSRHATPRQPGLCWPRGDAWPLELAEALGPVWHMCPSTVPAAAGPFVAVAGSEGCLQEGPQLCPGSVWLCQVQKGLTEKGGWQSSPGLSLAKDQAQTRGHLGEPRISCAAALLSLAQEAAASSPRPPPRGGTDSAHPWEGTWRWKSVELARLGWTLLQEQTVPRSPGLSSAVACL